MDVEDWRFVSELGCTVTVVPTTVTHPHLGEGVMLSGFMAQPGDGRYFEVYLSRENIHSLKGLLEKAMSL